MKRSAKLNVMAVIALTVTVVLFYLNEPVWALVTGVAGAGFAISAGRAMTTEPREPTRRRDERED